MAKLRIGMCLVAGALFALPVLAQPQGAAKGKGKGKGGFGPRNEITQVTGDIYRASNGNWYSLFYVTGEGIILADPINPAHAQWLKGELDQRYPDQPVRYVIYSHSHWDHIEGGAVFQDTAEFVAYEGVRTNMDGRYPHMPGDMVDRNGNGTIESEEISIPAAEHPGICGMPANFFPSHDRDGDGHMTSAEYFADVVPPTIFYSDTMKLTLGGRTVELFHPGKNHANAGTALYFPAERVLFSTDFPADALVQTSMRSLPSACGNFDQHPMREWIASYRAIEARDFDILAQGHGRALFTKADVTEGREFFEDVVAAVSAGIAAGKSLDELKETVLLEKYADWAYYDRLRLDVIESAYNNLMLYP